MLIRLFCSVTFDSWLEHWLVPASPCGKFLEFIPLFCLTFVVGAKGKKGTVAVIWVQLKTCVEFCMGLQSCSRMHSILNQNVGQLLGKLTLFRHCQRHIYFSKKSDVSA